MISSRVALKAQAGRRETRAVAVRARPQDAPPSSTLGSVVAGGLAALAVLGASPALADGTVKLPPISNDPERCAKGYIGNTLGMANGLSNTALDLRFCDYTGADLKSKTLSAAFMSNAKFTNADMTEATLTKAYALDANFDGANLTNAVIDRTNFTGSSMKNVNFQNAVITGTTFDKVDLTGASFEDALISGNDAKRLCTNPTLSAEAKIDVGCR
ncbi:unnamed protein product [Pedinophyceae sp. YPF-701]|nr:unnamed protein product [Pedinophyceae sp. YPF-701]